MLTEKPQVEATTRARVRMRSLRVGLPYSSEEVGCAASLSALPFASLRIVCSKSPLRFSINTCPI
jgi:hypothetical protein